MYNNINCSTTKKIFAQQKVKTWLFFVFLFPLVEVFTVQGPPSPVLLQLILAGLLDFSPGQSNTRSPCHESDIWVQHPLFQDDTLEVQLHVAGEMCASWSSLLVGSEVRLQHFQDLELLMDVQIHPGSFNPGVGIGLAGSKESCRGGECSQSLRG